MAANSRRDVCRAACVAALLVGGCVRREGPVLVLSKGGPAHESERGASLALRAIAPSECAELARGLKRLADGMEARANPFLVDLDDAPPEAALRAALRSSLPKWTAATALVAGRWSSSDEQSAFTAAPRCPTDDTCVAAWERGGPAEARRARFFAWPVSTMATLEFADESAAIAAAERLRERAAGLGSSIALVLRPESFAPRAQEPAESREVASQARRVLDAFDRGGIDPGDERELLEELATPRPPREMPGWLPLDARHVVVLPRLGTLARLETFTTELESTVGKRCIAHHPAPLN